MKDTVLANWNGQQMPLGQVKVSVLDRAFLFGDAVYEVIRIYRGQLFHASNHLERMKNSMVSMQITGVNIELLSDRLNQTLATSRIMEGLAYLQVTRGQAPRIHRYPKDAVPNVLIYVDNFDDPYVHLRVKGVSVITHPDIRWARNDIKVTSLAANCMAAQHAHEHGCMEVIFVDSEGMVTEGSHTSIFAVRNGALIVAPASPHVLPGITKKLILDLATACNLPLAEGRITQSDLFLLDELFLSGTPEEILPIVLVDGRPVSGGKPGPITCKLQEKFAEQIDLL